MTCFFSQLRNIAFLLILSTISLITSGIVKSEELLPLQEPISFIGHGVMFDHNGNEIIPTTEFIEKAQIYYIEQLFDRADENQKRRFEEFKTELAQGWILEGQTQFVVNSNLIEWLIKTVKPERLNQLHAKNNLMKFELEMKLPETSKSRHLRSIERFEIPEDLRQYLELELAQFEFNTPSLKVLSTKTDKDYPGGKEYIKLCRNSGVPIPPDWGDDQWDRKGPLSEDFLGGGLAEVFTFESFAPEGMCIALPRYGNNVIDFLGIICLGKKSAKACFWDNQKNGKAFKPSLGEKVSLEQFGGGGDLSINGICTDCHAGENPFVIHPGTPLGLPILSDLPLFADDWYEPLVKADWPQNPGPINSPADCVECHTVADAALSTDWGGRFPALSTDLEGYCTTILKKALRLTMPPGEGGSFGIKDLELFKSMCDQPPDDSDTPPPSFTSTIIAMHSNKCLDIDANSKKNEANAHQFRCHGKKNQSFLFNPVDGKNDMYTITAKHSNKCLDIKNSSRKKKANLLQWTCEKNQKNQQFILESVGSVSNKIFQIRPVHSGQCLDVAGNKKKNKANVIQWPCKKTQKNQQWKLNGYLK